MNTNQTLPPHVKKFRLGVFTSEYHQPISLMRVLGPLQMMAKEDPRLELVMPPLEMPTARNPEGGQQLGWNWLNGLDGVFFLHPETDAQCHSIALANSLRVPVWVEYVDDIFNVERHNPAWKMARHKDAQRMNVMVCCSGATVVSTVSAQNRQAIIDGLSISEYEDRKPIERKMIVLPEGCLWDAQDGVREKIVSWRGLGSHAGDIDTALPHLLDVAGRFSDWSWLFCGDMEITEELGRQVSKVTGPDRVLMLPMFPTPFDMMHAWGGQRPYLHIVPLADTKFNRSKSHLAWLEATAIGAACIVPDHLDEWKQPGVIRYHETNLVTTREDTLGETLAREMLTFDAGKMHPNVELARAAVYPNKTLKSLNAIRWAILRKMVPGGAATTCTTK